MDTTAARLGDRIEALAVALENAGVPPERSAALLGSASAATLHALTLVALRQPPAPAGPRRLAVVAEEAVPALAA
ncbi:MAG TPA: hypothetical protein VKP14_04090 [Gaiellaceae bacterium]|nr:hypothetical protein [Gaiellaceae bacterium]